MRDIKEVPSKDKASSAASFLINSMYADLNKQNAFQYNINNGCRNRNEAFETPYPFGRPVAGSVKIITLRTSPNLLKCRKRLSLVAAK